MLVLSRVCCLLSSKNTAPVSSVMGQLMVVSCRPPTAISQEEVQAEKDRMRAIDARPIKKVAEAKARKQKRMAVSMLPSTTFSPHKSFISY